MRATAPASSAAGSAAAGRAGVTANNGTGSSFSDLLTVRPGASAPNQATAANARSGSATATATATATKTVPTSAAQSKAAAAGGAKSGATKTEAAPTSAAPTGGAQTRAAAQVPDGSKNAADVTTGTAVADTDGDTAADDDAGALAAAAGAPAAGDARPAPKGASNAAGAGSPAAGDSAVSTATASAAGAISATIQDEADAAETSSADTSTPPVQSGTAADSKSGRDVANEAASIAGQLNLPAAWWLAAAALPAGAAAAGAASSAASSAATGAVDSSLPAAGGTAAAELPTAGDTMLNAATLALALTPGGDDASGSATTGGAGSGGTGSDAASGGQAGATDLTALAGLMRSPAAASPSGGIERSIPVPVFDTAWPHAVAAQVQLLAAANVQTATLRLSPEHLGPVEIHIDLQSSQINVNFVAAHPETRSALEQSVPTLRAMLAHGGLTLGQTQVHGEARSGSQSQPQRSAGGAAAGVEETPIAVSTRNLGLIDEYA